jgi:hypothetical protein
MGLLGISSVLRVMLAVSCSKVCSISWMDGRSWYAIRSRPLKVALVCSQLVGAALVSNDELPGHLDGWFPVVPVKGVEDVLIFVFESGSFKYPGVCLLGILCPFPCVI